MIIRIWKRRLKQLDGNMPDDITFTDIDTDEVFDFDGYIEILKKEKIWKEN